MNGREDMSSNRIILTSHFCRKEENGITFLYSEVGGMKILNRTGSLVYELASKGVSREAIVEHVFQRYQGQNGISVQRVENDVNNILFALRNMGFIIWEGVSMNQNTFSLAGEADYADLSDFIKTEKQTKTIIRSYMYSYLAQYYSVPAIRTRSFSAAEVYFIARDKKGTVSECISVAGLDNPIGTVLVTLMIYSEEKIVKQLFDFMIQYLNRLGIVKLKILSNPEHTPSASYDFIQSLGFKKECTLKSEFLGKDVDINSIFIQ